MPAVRSVPLRHFPGRARGDCHGSYSRSSHRQEPQGPRRPARRDDAQTACEGGSGGRVLQQPTAEVVIRRSAIGLINGAINGRCERSESRCMPRRGPRDGRISATESACRSAGAGSWDNAVAESFFATIKTEVIHRQPRPTRAAARQAIFEYVEGWYNTRRRHSSLGYLSPPPTKPAPSSTHCRPAR